MSVTPGTVPWPADTAARYRAEGYWRGRPLGTLFAEAVTAAGPGRVALVDGGLRLTHRQLASRVDGAALRLLELGLRPGDRIVVQLSNCWEFAVLVLACFRLGVMPVMALPAHRRHELSHLVRQAAATAIAVPARARDCDHQATAAEVAGETGLVEHILVAGEEIRPGGVDLTALCAPAADPATAAARLDAMAPDSDSVALFLLSGGTTGLPKLIARTHDDYACGIAWSAAACDYDAGTVYLAVLPMSHNFTLGGPGVLGALLCGGTVVVAGSPAPEHVFAAIARDGVTVTSAVPAVAQRWLDHVAAGTAAPPRSLRLLQVGGARLADHVATRVRPVLGCELQQGYGMAEGLICFTRPGDPDDVVCHTQGRPVCPADELLVVGEDGNPVPAGEPGVLLTRGPYTPRGYYRAPGHNATAFTADGWFRTGDVVRLRPDGYLVVEGRDKDMINRGGEKISAEEVENFAYRVGAVRQAAAVAMPDPELGERVCLYVVPHPGGRVALADVVAAMEQAGVARFKRPERLVVVDSLPVTNIGKTDKKALRADIAARLAA
ncbi:(2,3-dihydroxybenzoyl)adenylate synthase [Amycolatopsis suaedae]|uniref:(2,3-dihydroxybenzoyl)adenylate synthase n=1 Tax=Amycolatopsis suaedae TaxID=2510978 RepID=A0A4Q7J391_9PSEU|nr:AMP-binding protein [Amycolatopsis suaedae]RZQ61082.1 (2,3-dihydroxybenzoyl)adenylate synthase [Amycolatopsis suaedae]